MRIKNFFFLVVVTCTLQQKKNNTLGGLIHSSKNVLRGLFTSSYSQRNFSFIREKIKLHKIKNKTHIPKMWLLMRFLWGTTKVVNKFHMCNIFLKNDKKQSSEIQDIFIAR